MEEIFFFSFPPRGLWVSMRIGTVIDNPCHSLAKPSLHFFQHRRSAAVFDYIVQQRGNRHIFIPAGFQHQ